MIRGWWRSTEIAEIGGGHGGAETRRNFLIDEKENPPCLCASVAKAQCPPLFSVTSAREAVNPTRAASHSPHTPFSPRYWPATESTV